MSISDMGSSADFRCGSQTPRITVLLPVYNAERYLSAALQSILNQSYRNFRLIIIDDASTDSSREIIESSVDSRIETIRLDKSKGVAHALNLALDRADTEFVARMDADDLAAPERFEQQVTFFMENQEVGVCGSAIEMMRGQSRCLVHYPETHEEILGSLAVFRRSICHPSVMMRLSVLRDSGIRYSERYPHAEDLLMWNCLIRKTRFHNIQEPLLAYRLHDDQVSAKYKSTQIDGTRALLAATVPRYFPSAGEGVCATLLQLLAPQQCDEGGGTQSVDLRQLYARLVAANDRDGVLPKVLCEDVILSKFFEESCKQYLGFRNTVFVWLSTVQRQPVLFIEVARRLRFNWASRFLQKRNQ